MWPKDQRWAGTIGLHLHGCAPDTFPLFSPTGRLSGPSRRRRLVLRLSQKDTLQAFFQQNPYPGITTREWLARELGIPESRIQVRPSLPIHSPSRGPCPDASRPMPVAVLALGACSSGCSRQQGLESWQGRWLPSVNVGRLNCVARGPFKWVVKNKGRAAKEAGGPGGAREVFP